MEAVAAYFEQEHGLPGSQSTDKGQHAGSVRVLQTEVDIHPYIVDPRHQLQLEAALQLVSVQQALERVHPQREELIVLSTGQGRELQQRFLQSTTERDGLAQQLRVLRETLLYRCPAVVGDQVICETRF